MTVVPFHRSHIETMNVQESQRWLIDFFHDEIYDLLEQSDSYTALDGDEVLGCAGVVEIAPGRGLAWSYLSADVGNRLLYVTRAVRRFLDVAPFRRIEMDVDCDFEQAHRWARMLGFRLECPRREAYLPDGRDCALYARVKSWGQRLH